MNSNPIDNEIDTYLSLSEDEQNKINTSIKTNTLLFFILLVAVLFLSFIQRTMILNSKQKFQLSRVGFCEEMIFDIEEIPFRVNSAMINFQIINFLEKIRSIPLDQREMMNNWSEARQICLNKEKLVDCFYEWQVQEKYKENYTVYVNVEAIKERINNQFEVKWKETVWQGTSFKFENQYYGYFDYQIITPQTEDALQINPSGIFIKDMTLTKVEA